MPISILNQSNDNYELLAYLENENWELSSQLFELEKWLTENNSMIANGSSVADLGFQAREDARGGGAIVTVNLMKMMIAIGMELYLSEYP